MINISEKASVIFSSRSRWSIKDDSHEILTGNNNYNFSFHTEIEDNPYVILDLKKEYPICLIKIINRRDCCKERAKTLKIEASPDGNNYIIIHKGIIFFDEISFPLNNQIKCRFLKFSLEERNYFHLRLIQVFTDDPPAKTQNEIKFNLYREFSRLVIGDSIDNLSIFGNNCIAGHIYNFFGKRFNSPTINLQITPQNYVKFLGNLKHYISCNLVECSPDVEDMKTVGLYETNFPVGIIDDIPIYFQHYSTFDEARSKWNSRKLRINFEQVIALLVEYRDNCDDNIINKFKELPYKHIFFSTNFKKVKSFDEKSSYILKKNDNTKPWYSHDDEDVFYRRYFEQFNFIEYFLKNTQ